MNHPVDLRVLELLAARLCHELIGPVAAIGNGAELLADEEPHFVKDAVALVEEGVRKVDVWTSRYRLATVPFPELSLGDGLAIDPFFNANRPEDFARAAALLDRLEVK